jgi:hypothetical protein
MPPLKVSALRLAVVVGTSLAVPHLGLAQVFTYSNQDVIFAVQAPGMDDLIVDLGPVTDLINQTRGTAIDFTSGVGARYSTSLLTGNFGTTDGLTFSVFGVSSPAANGIANNTTFLTVKRTDPSVLSTAPKGPTASQAGGLKSGIQGILGISTTFGVTKYAPNATYPPSTSTALLIPSVQDPANPSNQDYKNSYTVKSPGLTSITTGLENKTAAGTVARSDFYEFIPGTSTKTATYLGNFTLDSSGALIFYRATVPEPSAYASIAALGLAAFAIRRRIQSPKAA